jgi:hypothetical protein
MLRAPSIRSQDDPLSLALRPPPSETEEERSVRLKGETEAKETSDKIDEEIKLEKQRLQKSKGDVKVYFNFEQCRQGARYSPVASVAPSAWPSRVGQIHAAETISINV